MLLTCGGALATYSYPLVGAGTGAGAGAGGGAGADLLVGRAPYPVFCIYSTLYSDIHG